MSRHDRLLPTLASSCAAGVSLVRYSGWSEVGAGLVRPLALPSDVLENIPRLSVIYVI